MWFNFKLFLIGLTASHAAFGTLYLLIQPAYSLTWWVMTLVIGVAYMVLGIRLVLNEKKDGNGN
jgi:hypothetical protein